MARAAIKGLTSICFLKTLHVSVVVRMLTSKELTKKNVRFHEICETFNYSFPCDVCEYETSRKKELEYHLLYQHSISQSFTHSNTLSEEPLTLPSLLLLGLGTVLYLSSYAWLLLSSRSSGPAPGPAV